jgi:hypothetical protein
MRLCYALSLPLLVVAAFAQSAQQPTAPTQQSTPAQQTAPSAQSGTPQLQLRDLPADPHTPTPEEEAQQKAAQMRLQLSRIASAQANWGPAISTAGASVALKETGRTKTATGTQITWQITGTGFTPDMQLTLVRWPINQGVTNVMSGLAVDATGTAVCGPAAPGPAAPAAQAPADAFPAVPPQAPSCTKTMQPGAPVTITATAAKGEAIRVALVAADHKHGAAVSLVPFPLEGTDKGCKIDVILGSKDGELILVTGEGFQKDATFTLGTESFGEKHPINATINPQGRFTAALTPWVPGHVTGDTVVYYQSSTCSPTVSFNWGKDSYKPE